MKGSDLKLIGQIPSPYGVPINVFEHPDTKDEFLHDVDSCMTLAAIHDPDARNRCKAALSQAMGGNVRFQIFMDHGGRTVPRTALPRPAKPIYPTLPRLAGMTVPIENWVTLAQDQRCWAERAAGLLHAAESCLIHAEEWGEPWTSVPEILGLGVSHLLTAALEHLCETEIDCLEAAAFYALTLHDEWVSPAVEWLEPFRATWFADWIRQRPVYLQIAERMLKANADLPNWIAGGEA